MARYTRQGVKDLNHLRGKSVGRKLELPPDSQFCAHPIEKRKEYRFTGNVMCLQCGEFFGWDNNR